MAQLRAALRLPRAGLTLQQQGVRELCKCQQEDETALYQVRITLLSVEDKVKETYVLVFSGGRVMKKEVTLGRRGG